MSTKGVYLQEEAGMLACYGKSFQRHKEDCIECQLQSDCESLTKLRKERQRARVAKKKDGQTKAKVKAKTYYPWSLSSNYEESEEIEVEEEEEEESDGYSFYYRIDENGKTVKVPFKPENWYQNNQCAVPTPNAGHWQMPPAPMPIPPMYMQPMPPMPVAPYYVPGVHNTSFQVPHPLPHLTYVQANPIDCPMPFPGEPWWRRFGKNMLTGMASEGGRQIFEFFRRWKL